MVQTVASAFEFWIVIFQPKTNNQKKKILLIRKLKDHDLITGAFACQRYFHGWWAQ